LSGALSYHRFVGRPRIGELLIEARVITQDQLDQALSAKETDGRKIGQILTEMGAVTETQLTQLLGRQLSVPWVSLYHIDFSRQLLNLVPRELAERYCVVPIYVRRVRKQGDTLYVAMDDPTNESALAEVGKSAALPVRPMIACPSDIRSAIRVYYGGALSDTDVTAPPPAPHAPTKETARADAVVAAAEPLAAVPEPSGAPGAPAPAPDEPAAPPSSVGPDKDSPDAWPEVEAHTLPVKPRGGPRMIAMTLLDGTTIHLPARPSKRGKEPSGPPGALTARDLIRALRAVAQGQDASDILGEKVPLEAICAALLSILLKKGLVADWEFVEELRKL
jgi:type IV pilus assembly protein PilB